MKRYHVLIRILLVGFIVFIISLLVGMSYDNRRSEQNVSISNIHRAIIAGAIFNVYSVLDAVVIADEPEYVVSDTGYYETGNSEYKPYEDYWMITDTTSKAYQFLNSSDVQVNSEGYMMYQDEYYCVALGHYFGTIGDKFLITLDSGFQFKAIIGDMKSYLHTDELGYAHQNGHIVEFIIDSNHPYMQNINIKYHGLINVADSKFQGSIINIERIEEIR